jgi:arsenate reductase
MSLRVYSYDRCSTCRDALKFLRERDVAHEEVPIRETPPSLVELRTMLAHVGGEVRRLFNSSGQEYRALDLKQKLPSLTLDQALQLLSTNGRLVKRPFALGPSAGAVGFKAQEWEKFARTV